MDVVRFFGALLARETQLKLMPCSGMIRLALKDMGKQPEMYRFREIRALLNKYLKNRLERAGVKDNEKIIRVLNTELIKNQSLILMTTRSK